MGIRQRRERERRDVRQAIFSAAREIALQDGWPSVTIRKVADRIEYSPPTIYEHFESKEAILVALMRQGFRLLLDEIRAAYESAGDPETGFFRAADAYWDFAYKYPEMYQVMMGLGGVPFCADGEPVEAHEVLEYAVQMVQQVVTAKGIRLDDPIEVVKMVWGTVHGLVALSMVDGIFEHAPSGKHLIQRAMKDFLAGWRARQAT